MPTLKVVSQSILENKNLLGKFLIEPLDAGQGITIGNTFRRTLLNDIKGISAIGFFINDVKNECDIVANLREDLTEIILNIKEIKFVVPLMQNNVTLKYFKAMICTKGPKIITS